MMDLKIASICGLLFLAVLGAEIVVATVCTCQNAEKIIAHLSPNWDPTRGDNSSLKARNYILPELDNPRECPTEAEIDAILARVYTFGESGRDFPEYFEDFEPFCE